MLHINSLPFSVLINVQSPPVGLGPSNILLANVDQLAVSLQLQVYALPARFQLLADRIYQANNEQ